MHFLTLCKNNERGGENAERDEQVDSTAEPVWYTFDGRVLRDLEDQKLGKETSSSVY